ncbi:MAG: hypothetical protein NVV74_18845 [Magnetospirillum sp.]|nr:hypothetical protein [Magnetospirillum sp.]
MAQPKIVDLAEYRRARQPYAQAEMPVPAPVCWVPVWVVVPAWRSF